MSWSASDIDALDTAIKNATLEVEYNGRKVRYRSMRDLLAARALAVQELSKANLASGGNNNAAYSNWSF